MQQAGVATAQQYFEIGVTAYRSRLSDGADEVPIVLVHAFPIDHRMWDEAADQLITRFGTAVDSTAVDSAETNNASEVRARDIYAFEMPGAGKTPIPDASQIGEVAADGAYTQAMDRMAESFVAQLHALGYSKAIWVGISMGGYAVLALHRLFPNAVQGLVLCDTKSEGDQGQSRANRLRIAEICESEHTTDPVMHFVDVQPNDSAVKRSPAYIERFTAWIRSQNPEGVAWRQRMAAGRTDETPYLADIKVPVGVICGRNDPSSPPEAMAAMAEHMTGTQASVTVIEDAGHFSCVEQPAVFAQALAEYLARVDEFDAPRS